MKTYWSIPGPKDCPIGNPCIAFKKLDGSNIRAEWKRKSGWHNFGTRHRILDPQEKPFGAAIECFMSRYAEPLEKFIRDHKVYRSADNVVAFCEFFGPSSFAGWHDDSESKEVILIDLNIHKRGIMPPREFLDSFSHLPIPEVVYEGNFNRSFIQDVREGKYGLNEGVVAKGLMPGKKPPHSLWMAKAKTQWWLDELKRRAAVQPEVFGSALSDNLREQTENVCV
jgi:hypothetical protein